MAYDWPLLRRGDEGFNVRILQYLLRAQQQQVGVDGQFGPQTEGAVRNFQSARHLGVDGVVGDQTWSALIIQVQRGSKGDAVRAVQERLGVAVDGDFGPATVQAVRHFQDEWAPPADGIVGPNTWRALVSPQCAQ